MARLLLVRHGQSTWNAIGRWQGKADPPLSPLGEAQAEEAVAHLNSFGFETVWSSTLQRARRTAEVLAAGLGFETVHADVDLGERDVGLWTGLTRAEIAERWPAAGRAWAAGQVPIPVDGEEPGPFMARVTSALRRIASTCDGDLPVLVVSHGGVIGWLASDLGAERGEFTNLGGRWFDVDVEQAVITPGETVWSFAPTSQSMTNSL